MAKLKIDGLKPDEISGQDLRVAVGRTLGWQHILSTAFDLGRQSSTYVFSGRGSGHGVGLCVIGSARLGAQGKSAATILARYFPGLPIDTVSAKSVAPASDVIVSLADDDEGEREAIARMTAKARDELARALGVPAPPRVALRVHPTTDDYTRATGAEWFTAGALVGGELHLLPLAALRERGVLEQTVRHELVHVMTDPVLSQRPMWVREGAAIYFAGDRPIPGEPLERPAFVRPEPRASCPDDNELLRPVSVGALANAYARARSCFAKQIAAGKSWREVK